MLEVGFRLSEIAAAAQSEGRFSDDPDIPFQRGAIFEQQKQYEREARLQWDPDLVNSSIKLWNSYSQAQKDAVMAEAVRGKGHGGGVGR